MVSTHLQWIHERAVPLLLQVTTVHPGATPLILFADLYFFFGGFHLLFSVYMYVPPPPLYSIDFSHSPQDYRYP